MSAAHVPAIDHTVQETNIWLKGIAKQLHFADEHHAYSALRAVLHALRDRLTPESAVHLGAQLPMLVRGIYYEGWHIAGKPTNDRSTQEFADHVLVQLPPQFPMDPLTGIVTVTGTGRHYGEGPAASGIKQRPRNATAP